MMRRVLAGALTAGVAVLFLSAVPASAQTDQEAEPECGVPSESQPGMRASLQAAGQPVEVVLGRDDGLIEREVRMAWTDGCQVSDRAGMRDNLQLLRGVLAGPESSIPFEAMSVVSVDPFDKTVRVVVGFDRDKIAPGRYEGTLVLEADLDGAVVARGQVAVIVTRQEEIVGPHWYWNPVLVGLAAGVAGLLFGWWRAKALSAFDETDIKFFAMPTFQPRNFVALIVAAGAGIAAWTLNYLKVPDFRMTTEAVFGLFPLVAGAVATSLMTFLRPDVSFRHGADEPTSVEPDALGKPDATAPPTGGM